MLGNGWVLRRCILRPAFDRAGGCTALLDDLVEPAIKSRQGVRNAIGALVRLAGIRAWGRVRGHHAFKLPRQGVETLIDGGEVFADGVLVVVRLSV